MCNDYFLPLDLSQERIHPKVHSKNCQSTLTAFPMAMDSKGTLNLEMGHLKYFHHVNSKVTSLVSRLILQLLSSGKA